MQRLLVVDNPSRWPISLPDLQVVDAQDYINNPEYASQRHIRVYNINNSYRYQSMGYYVSLLAEARGHRPLPNVTTIQDLNAQTITSLVSEELNQVIQQALAPLKSEEFVLSIYFGKNVAVRYDRLARKLFDLFQMPILRAYFEKEKETWKLLRVKAITSSEIKEEHWPFLAQFAKEYFKKKSSKKPSKKSARYDLAILYNPDDPTSASDEVAIKKFVKAAEKLEIDSELISKSDLSHLAEFDALFIRETTAVNHHTYRFSRRAAAIGLVVIDDPASIVKCTNKVYLYELLQRYKVPSLKTAVIHPKNFMRIKSELNYPCVLKKPDSSSSLGVIKVSSEEEFLEKIKDFLKTSELILAQEFRPTEFDWRIGVIDKAPLYACKYHMAKHHWQVTKWSDKGTGRHGRVEAIALDQVPKKIIKTALKSAELVGDGLYGIDIKELTKSELAVIEINDNPTIEAGYEDGIEKDRLYQKVMQVFLERIEKQKQKK